MRRVFQTHFVCRRERRTEFLIKLSVFKEKNILIYITILFTWVVYPPTVIRTNPTRLPTARLSRILSNNQKYFLNILSTQIFFYFWDSPWDSLNLIFILSKNNDFLSGVLLKMPPSSPSIEEFDLDIQK